MAFLNKGLTIVLRDERNGDTDGEAEEPDAAGFVAKVKEYTSATRAASRTSSRT